MEAREFHRQVNMVRPYVYRHPEGLRHTIPKVLYVSPNATDCRCVLYYLSRYFQIEIVHRTEDAEDLAIADQPPDVIVSRNVFEYNGKGFLLYRSLQADERTRPIPFIIRSLLASTVERAHQRGIKAIHYDRPYDELAAYVSACLRGRSDG